MKEIKQNHSIVIFERCGGGFPTGLKIINQHQEQRTLLEVKQPFLSITLSDGRIVRPFIPDHFRVFEPESEGPVRIGFHKIPWRDDEGLVLNDFYLSLDYELWADGTVFVDTFFMVESSSGPDISGFKLEIPLCLAVFDRIKWGAFPGLKNEAANAIIALSPERFRDPGEDRVFPGKIIPVFNFNCTREGGDGMHLEFFVEGQGALSGTADEVASQLSWHGNDPVMSWDFQTVPRSCRRRPWQWRNQWGFLAEPAPATRRYPPLKMYHYFDNSTRYPTNAWLEKMVASGMDLLILHENWRLDPQNGGVPYDWAEFMRVVDKAHSHNVRVAVYIRGNENSVEEGACTWFDSLLHKNFDGLYMDYGSPFCELSSGSEMFPGGRMNLRRHYLKMRALRQRVGENGILISHTGPVFSALGMTGGLVDSYLSGEGEKGVMVHDRETHRDYSEALAVIGSFGPAAFPAYRTTAIIPFLAATGQSPHTPLGIQFASSSLAHPHAPGINDLHLRPLSKLWGLLRGQHCLTVINDYNSRAVFKHDENTGAYLFIAGNRKLALLILANFNDCTKPVSCMVDWSRTPINSEIETFNCFLLTPDHNAPGIPARSVVTSNFEVMIPGKGVAGFLLVAADENLTSQLAEYCLPYPKPDDIDMAFLNEVQKQQQLRKEPEAVPNIYLRVEIPDLPIAYEDSIWYDLFDTELLLFYSRLDKTSVPLGWIGLDGLHDRNLPPGKYIQPGLKSEWIALHELLTPGEWELGIKSLHNGEPFYSFIEVTLSPEPNDTESVYKLYFSNQIDDDRALIIWKVKLADQAGYISQEYE